MVKMISKGPVTIPHEELQPLDTRDLELSPCHCHTPQPCQHTGICFSFQVLMYKICSPEGKAQINTSLLHMKVSEALWPGHIDLKNFQQLKSFLWHFYA